MEDLLLPGDCKGGSLLRVEGAQRLVIPATALQREVLSDHLDDVVAPTNLFDDVLRDMVSHKNSLNASS
jgi:hypothetical protein